VISNNGSVHDQKLQPRNGAAPLVAPFGFPHARGSHSIGHDLTPADIGTLEMRWIDPDLARRAGLRRVDSLTGAEMVGRKGGDYSGIAIPYFHPGSERAPDYQRLLLTRFYSRAVMSASWPNHGSINRAGTLFGSTGRPRVEMHCSRCSSACTRTSSLARSTGKECLCPCSGMIGRKEVAVRLTEDQVVLSICKSEIDFV